MPVKLVQRADNFWRDGKYGPVSGAERFALYNQRAPGRHTANLRRRRNVAQTKIAVLDMETDPFDPITQQNIYPFLAILYTGEFDPIIIWDENWRNLISRLLDAIVNLPGRYVVYAHNGGRFDYMFLVHELRGEVVFKGRGIMSAKIGRHELRDSFHILPEKLQAIGGKDEIDYQLMMKKERNKPINKTKIIKYCLSDCKYLYDSVKAFREKFGGPITIGQAALKELRRSYDIQNLDNETDLFLRSWFFGGRVECYRYGIVRGNFHLYDVNSMYPFVMASMSHPISSEIFIHDRIREGKTAFITLRCRNNGALVARGFDGGLTTGVREGIFNTTIWEYEIALRHSLIDNVEIIRTVEFQQFQNFNEFVQPIYERRQLTKRLLDATLRVNKNSEDVKAMRFSILFDKLLLNNAYGKLAQNPRRFKDHYITACGELAPTSEWGLIPEIECDDYWIWTRPCPEFRFNNVATAASITGAARAVLLDCLCHAKNPLYCDTDSIICSDIDDSIVCDAFTLGAWDCETDLTTFIGNGKKLYAYERPDNSRVIKAKGLNGVTWDDMLNIAAGEKVSKVMMAPTLTKDGVQHYITRELRRTGVV